MLKPHFPGNIQQSFLEALVQAFDLDEYIQVRVLIGTPSCTGTKNAKVDEFSKCGKALLQLHGNAQITCFHGSVLRNVETKSLLLKNKRNAPLFQR